MLGRLLIGIVKGLILGALVGFALVKLGVGLALPTLVAYLAAAVTGILVGLIAGKPIWAKDAKIEAGMKAFAGALLGAGLMYAVRRWITVPAPAALVNLVDPSAGALTLGDAGMTSLAMVAALLGGFYEADNDASEGDAPTAAKKLDAPRAKRIATAARTDEADDEADEEVDPRRAKK